MGVTDFVAAVRADATYQSQLREAALAAEAAGPESPEWETLMAHVSRHWKPKNPKNTMCGTTITTFSTPDCTTTTTTTTWY
jgi:hypothetical protein